MTPRIPRARFGALVTAMFASLVVASSVSAHAELVDASPPDKSTVVGSPGIVEGSYSETLDPAGSSLVLVDATGAVIARGGVPGPDPTPLAKKTMSITGLSDLTPGTYTVKSTTKSADDGDIERTQWTFTVEAAPATASDAPTPVCTDECNGQPSGGETPTPVPTTTASAPPTNPTSSGSDAIVPVIAALAIVAVGGLFLMNRGRRSGTRP